ncbi:MAG: peroxiredoxin [Phycisphaerales bacterium]|nr:peroxiredoxin [Phycisphaerales bacterium]
MRIALLVLLLLGGCAASDSATQEAEGRPSDEFRTTAAPRVVGHRRDRPPPQVTEAAASERSSAIGKPAPDFELLDQEERPVSLSALRGQWVVLYFYPADDTPGCTCQANEFTRLIQSFHHANAKVIGVSVDRPEIHRRFIRKYNLRIPLLSDPDRRVMREYGAWVDIPRGPAAPGMVIRSTYLIDPTGRIAWHWPEVIPQGHAQRVMDRLNALQRLAPRQPDPT